MNEKIDALVKEIKSLSETQIRLTTVLNEAVVKKDEFYHEVSSIRKENRVLVGVLVVLGGALGTWVKLVI